MVFASSIGTAASENEHKARHAPASDVAIVPIPALVVVLLNKELEKGSPLTRREVESLRNKTRRMTLPRALALKLQARRGYSDVDLENCWEDWSARRAEFGLDRPTCLPRGRGARHRPGVPCEQQLG